MAKDSLNVQSNLNNRIESIDVLRGLTILVMIFVNDLAHVANVPYWMKHFKPGTDGMTFVDVVFPAFLFIIGMSMPFAIGKRLDRGDSLWSVWKHILIRTFSLLIIGVLMVNSYAASSDGLLNPYIWTLLMYLGVILVWNTRSKTDIETHSAKWWGRWIGALLLIVLAFLFRGNDVNTLIQLRPLWWGILGLIGWAYLLSCIIYIPLRRNLTALMGMLGILFCFFIAAEANMFSDLTFITKWITISYTFGSHTAIIISGVILGIIISPGSEVKTHKARIKWAFFYGLGMAVAGIMLHSFRDLHSIFIIDKNMGTPAWCLLTSAYTAWIWIIIYWIMDVMGLKKWAVIIRPAGNNALFAYILAPIFYTIFELIATVFNGYNFYHHLGSSFMVGFWRAVVFAFLVTWLTGGLRRLGIWLKL